MKIKKWVETKDQMCQIGRHNWSVSRLIELSKDLTVFDAPIDCLNLYCVYEKLTIRELAMHFNAVNDADLSKPIILDEDGELMDGRHRLIKAIMQNNKTIKAVRFDENPSPCRIDD